LLGPECLLAGTGSAAILIKLQEPVYVNIHALFGCAVFKSLGLVAQKLEVDHGRRR